MKTYQSPIEPNHAESAALYNEALTNDIMPNQEKRLVCSVNLYCNGPAQKPTENALDLIKVLKHTDLGLYFDAMEIINAMDYDNGTKGKGEIDPIFFIWTLYGAGIIEGKRQERARWKE